MLRTTILVVAALTMACITDVDLTAIAVQGASAAEEPDGKDEAKPKKSTGKVKGTAPRTPELLMDLIRKPTRETYMILRERVVSSEAYQPYSLEIVNAGKHYKQKEFKKARDLLRRSMGNLLLSPRAHYLLAAAYAELGDEQKAGLEQRIGRACLEGLLTTGDGSKEKPYIVVRLEDEYDILKELGMERKSQSLLKKDGKGLDMITCKDGSEYWFDVTDIQKQAKKLLGQ